MNDNVRVAFHDPIDEYPMAGPWPPMVTLTDAERSLRQARYDALVVALQVFDPTFDAAGATYSDLLMAAVARMEAECTRVAGWKSA